MLREAQGRDPHSRGQTIDETIFGIIYTIDEDDPWDDPASLIKANPNYGVSVFPDFLLAQLQQAKRSASKQNAFRTKHLNQWVGARTVWMNMLAWQRQSATSRLRTWPAAAAGWLWTWRARKTWPPW